ncbi:MAG: HNH endonuclease signature motif containing protein [Nocardioidaceae bacterium]
MQDWIRRLSTCTIRPVLDLARDDSVDVHDPPGWLRETVTLRDGHCVFPGCGIDARACDVDHIEPHLDPDDGGPPGQTHPENLACL